MCLVADDLEDEEMKKLSGEETRVEVSSVVELSLNSMVGLTAPRTFKVKWTVEDQEIVIMIDCGTTHNFISLKLVDELKLPMAETTNYGVIMGSGKAVQGRGMCKKRHSGAADDDHNGGFFTVRVGQSGYGSWNAMVT